jgi:hypothetical protein
MAASGSAGPGATLTLSPIAQYVALLVLFVGSVVASYVLKIFPNAIGNLGAGLSIVGIFTYAAHGLEQEGSPSGFPPYLGFIVVTVGTAAMGAIGSFTGDSLLTVGAFLTWLIVVLTLLYHAIAQDAGANLPQNAELWFLSIVGVSLSLGTWYLAGATDGFAGLVATFVAAVPMYFHLAGGSITPTPPAAPTGAAA